MTTTEAFPRNTHTATETSPQVIPDFDHPRLEHPEFFNDGRLQIVIAGLDDNVRDFAFEAAHAEQEERLASLKGARGIIGRIVRGNLLRQHYLRKGAIDNMRTITEQNNLLHFHGISPESSYGQAVTKRFAQYSKDYIYENAGEKCLKISSNSRSGGRFRRDILGLIEKRVLDGKSLQDKAAFDQAAQEIIRKHLRSGTNGKRLREAMGDCAVQANNLWKVAENIESAAASLGWSQEELRNNLGQLLDGADFIIGKARVGARSSFARNKIDRVIEKLGTHRLSHELGIVGATSFVCALGGLAMQRTVGVIGTSAAVAAWAARREGRMFNDDRQARSRNLAIGKESSLKGRAKKMTTGDYETASAADFMHRMELFYDSSGEMHINSEDDLRDLIKLIVGYDARIRLHADKDLIKADSAATLDSSRDSILYALSKLKADLKIWLNRTDPQVLKEKYGLGNEHKISRIKSEPLENLLDAGSYQKIVIEEDIAEKDLATRAARRKRMAMAGAAVLVLGSTVGTLVQELGAFVNPDVEGLLENKIKKEGDSSARGQTLLRSIVGLLRPDGLESVIAQEVGTHNVQLGGTTLTIPETFKAKVDGKSFSLTGHGIDISDLDLEKDGTLTQSSQIKLEEAGFVIEATSSQQAVTETTTRTVNATQFVKAHPELFKDTKIDMFYTNNTSRPDGTETILQFGGNHGVDSKGNYVISLGDLSGQVAKQGNHKLNLQHAAGRGKLWLGLSASGSTNGKMALIQLDAKGKAIIDKNSPLASLFAPGKPGQYPTLKGHHVQAFEHLGTDSKGNTLIRPIATMLGENKATFTDVIEQTKANGAVDYALQYDIPTGSPTTLIQPSGQELLSPIVVPLSSRGAMQHEPTVRSHRRNQRKTISGSKNISNISPSTDSSRPSGRHRKTAMARQVLITGDRTEDTRRVQQVLDNLRSHMSVGKAKRELQKILKEAGLDRSGFHISSDGTRVRILARALSQMSGGRHRYVAV